MKVLFYSHTGKVSGAERILLLLLERLDRARIVPSAACPGKGGLLEDIRSLGVSVEEVDEVQAKFDLSPKSVARSISSVFRAVGQLRAKISKDAPDVIHANSVRAGVVATLASSGSGIPVVWHVQDELRTHLYSTAIRVLVRFSRRTSIVAVSHATLQSFRGRILSASAFADRSTCVFNGVDSSRFDVTDEKGEEVRRELGISRSEVVFGCIGQITPRKNQKGVVEAFAMVAERIPSALLMFVGAPIFEGDVEYFEEVKALVAAHGLDGRVDFLGQRSDVAEIISATDAVVINSHSEALVLVAIEAMMGGRPVIATHVGGTAELIEHMVSGWLIPAGDEVSLSDALASFALNPALRISLAKEGKRVARSKFTAERMIADFERFMLGRIVSAERREMPVVIGEAVAGTK